MTEKNITVLSGEPDKEGSVYGVSKTPIRYQLYSSKSQQYKNGTKGRWQKWNGYGWDNCDYEDEFMGWTK